MSTPNPADQDRFEVFNRDRTIGVSALSGGAVSGFYLHSNVRKMNERDLARQILKVADVAAMRGRLHVRELMEAAAAARGATVPPNTYEVLPDVPTAEQYEAFKRENLQY